MRLLILLSSVLVLYSCTSEKSDNPKEIYSLLTNLSDELEEANRIHARTFCRAVNNRKPTGYNDPMCEELKGLNTLIDTFTIAAKSPNSDLKKIIDFYSSDVDLLSELQKKYSLDTSIRITALQIDVTKGNQEDLAKLMLADLIWKKNIVCREIFSKVSIDEPVYE